MLRIVPLPDEMCRGHLFLDSMPGRFEPLDISLQTIVALRAAHVLCLVSDEEIARKSPDYHAAIQRNEIPVKLWRFDIPDYGMPENPDALDQMLDRLIKHLGDGDSLVIHCAAGHGRTGMVAIRLLVRMGMPLKQATETIRLAGSAPDNRAQQEFLRTWADS